MKLQPGPEDRGRRLDVFLAGRLPEMTRSQIQAMNQAGGIRIDERTEKAGYKIRGGETIEVDLKPAAPSHLEPRQIPLHIHYEDDDLAVVEKPAGMVVHPGSGTGDSTLVHALLFHFGRLSSSGPPERPGIVHRLDKWTSGLLIVAKNDRAHARLGRFFQERSVEKTYIALVHGKLQKPTGEIEMNIVRHSAIRTRMAVERGRGRVAHTAYRLIEQVRGFSLVEVKIKTGRTHQIRVHFAAIGHPVVGDNVYGATAYRRFVEQHGDPGRYFLHAGDLRFKHPETGADMHFHSPLPQELESLLTRLRS
jgi:23S rRNA pseudouridine1911/1915/1917 synthase